MLAGKAVSNFLKKNKASFVFCISITCVCILTHMHPAAETDGDSAGGGVR